MLYLPLRWYKWYSYVLCILILLLFFLFLFCILFISLKLGTGIITEKETSNIYEGEFYQGKKHGDGVLTTVPGAVYTGKWVEGVMDKKCYVTNYPIYKNYKLKSLNVYDDNSNDNEENEEKESNNNNNSINKNNMKIAKNFYAGILVDNLPSDNNGVCLYGDGGEFCGTWKNGRRNGQGVYISNRGDKYIGRCGV